MRRTPSVDRRTVLKATAATLGLTALNSAHADSTKTNWIDSHSHIWTNDVAKYPLAGKQTVADLKPAAFTDAELLKLANQNDVGRVVLIQHSIYHRYDNRYVLDIARRQPKTFRVVAEIDDTQANAAELMPDLLAQGATGFRITPFLHEQNQDRWLDTPGMGPMWKVAAKTRQAICCLLGPSDLPRIEKMCQEHPETPVVIDHLARIGYDGVVRDSDIAALCKLAAHPQVKVKVSAFYALGAKQPPYHDLIPLVRRVFEAFGPQRLMWGSDSPYQLTNGNSYAASLKLVREDLDFLSDSDRRWLLQKTADRTFFF